MIITPLLQLAAEKKASDLFLSVGAPINIKIDGVVMPVNAQKLDEETVKRIVYEMMTEQQIAMFELHMEMNFSFRVPHIGNFRVNVFRQRSSVAMVIRYVRGDVLNVEELNLPLVLKELVMEKRGLVLMVGATGSGKSTTLAAMIQHRNETQSGHILTIEDPLEYMFRHNKSIVNQREVGTDTLDMKIGLKNALRQAPDCILIGEVRDKEGMTSAIQYAQSGHLCLATLHANNSYHAMNRIISFYPLESRSALLQDLSATLKCVISQRLVKNVRGLRSAAVEVMLNSRYIAELIEKGEINQMKEAMEKALTPGSQTFEQSLFKMIGDGVITQEEALANADSANNLLWLINNTEAGAALAAGAEKKPEGKPAMDPNTRYSNFKLGETEDA